MIPRRIGAASTTLIRVQTKVNRSAPSNLGRLLSHCKGHCTKWRPQRSDVHASGTNVQPMTIPKGSAEQVAPQHCDTKITIQSPVLQLARASTRARTMSVSRQRTIRHPARSALLRLHQPNVWQKVNRIAHHSPSMLDNCVPLLVALEHVPSRPGQRRPRPNPRAQTLVHRVAKKQKNPFIPNGSMPPH
jgi:hypothetical protein